MVEEKIAVVVNEAFRPALGPRFAGPPSSEMTGVAATCGRQFRIQSAGAEGVVIHKECRFQKEQAGGGPSAL